MTAEVHQGAEGGLIGVVGGGSDQEDRGAAAGSGYILRPGPRTEGQGSAAGHGYISIPQMQAVTEPESADDDYDLRVSQEWQLS